MFPLLFFLVALLPFSAEAGEIQWGKEVIPHSWPFMAYISFYDMNTKKVYSCSGFLVQDDIVITAAHCYGSKINVTLGAHDINKKEDTQQVIPVLKAVPHKSYNSQTLVNNIMLLKLKYKAHLNTAVNTIALPKSQDWVKPGQVCSVAGWGRLANGQSSNPLQEVDLEVQNEQKCESIFRNYNNAIQLCVGNPYDKKSTSFGDSGGPFVCNKVPQGIASYAQNTGKLPHVFTRTSSVRSWIEATIKLLKHL
ncbi:mast cell protease 8-like [Dipodomys spectabilis]|uniref:mast cell protease 8-like n=1 Tax=Dipodomys spectabilis TaxID=105255 RepID=UPI001C53CDC1|nr:mast cell protease 8-like [Dipodomys spectabilis]